MTLRTEMLLVGLLSFVALAVPARAEGIYHPVKANRGMVVCRDAEACRVGVEILRNGGNAVDAAVAVAFALAVTVPGAGNIGGGGFMLIHDASDEKVHAIDYRETAPVRATETMFLGSDGEPDNALSRNSHLSSGVPGTVAGMALALEKFGTISWAEAIAPAIAIAEDGFAVPPSLAEALRGEAKRLSKWEASRKIFLRQDGSAWQEGETLVQSDLAQTLRTIAAEGRDGFYRGRIAAMIAKEMERHGGLITREDLAAYTPRLRKPVRGEYRGLEIYSMPPPSSGGVHLVQMLNILEGFDLRKAGHNSAKSIHWMAEAMRLAYADRSEFLGDSDFVKVPVDHLTSPSYGKALQATIASDRARASIEVKAGAHLPADTESTETTHFCVIDKDGNAVSNTYTLNLSFGSGIVVTGAGFLLNNQMDDFSAKPGTPNAFGLRGGAANAIAPGKRMLSSMSPTIVRRDGKPVMLTGGVGGSRIITTVLQVVLNVFEHGLNVQEAINAPRAHHQWFPDQLNLEPGFSPDTIRLLEAMGHQVRAGTEPRSAAGAIFIDRDANPAAGEFFYHGAADPRKRASAMGY
jgi:gamma-glutamyltranspeptidase/glutathione hydrolase